MFESEDQLREVAKPLLEEELTDNDGHPVEEFSYSGGRTDIVYTVVSDPYKKRRVEELGIDIPIEDKQTLKIFLHLHKKGKPILRENFNETSGWRTSEINDSLDWLIDNKFVIEEGSKIRTTPYLRRHITTSIAVELKLEKWNRALQQALKGRAYSQYQYVVLDEANIHRALREIGLFEKHEIGLIGVSKRGDIEVHYSPERQSPYSQLNVWRLNETTLSLPSTLEA